VKLLIVLLLTFIITGNKTFAQTEPTLDETVEWIRSKLIAYGGSSGILDVQFDTASKALAILYSDKTDVLCYISNLNASSFAWEATKDDLYLEIPSTLGNFGSTRYTYSSYDNKYNKDVDRGFARFIFSTAKFGNEENLQDRFTKAMKNLIKLCGGNVSAEKF